MQLGLKIKKYYHHSKKTLYHYQFPKVGSINHLITDEANALVLDEDTKIISGNFRRIRDLYDEYSDVIDWSQDARVELQEDGALVKIDLYDGRMMITTKEGIGGQEDLPGIPDRKLDGALSALLYTKYRNARPVEKFYRGFTYVFQFVYPTSDTFYRYPGIILLTVIDKLRGVEMPIQFVEQFAKNNNFDRPIHLPCGKLVDAIRLAKQMKHKNKGIVIADKKFNRVLYRNKTNLDLLENNNFGGLVMDKFAQAVLDGEQERIKYYHPNYATMLDLFAECIAKAKVRLEGFWKMYEFLPKDQFVFKSSQNPLEKVLASRRRGDIQSFNNIEQLLTSNKLIILTATHFAKQYDAAYRTLVEETFKNENKEVIH